MVPKGGTYADIAASHVYDVRSSMAGSVLADLSG